MRPVKIITDSSSDLSPALLEKYDIDCAKMNIFYKGEIHPADLNWSTADIKGFYEHLRKGDRISTTQVPVDEINRVFTKYLDLNFDIVYIGCSTKQSGSVNTATVIAHQLHSKYPLAQIFCVDSYNTSIGEGMLAIEAAKLAKEGLSAEDIQEHIIAIRKRVNQFVTVHTLDFLRKSNKIKGTSAFFGYLIGIKPIIISDMNGNQVSVKKSRGRDASLVDIVQMLKDSIIDGENQTVYLVHADCPDEEIIKLQELIKMNIPCKELLTLYIGPVTGTYIGANAIGVFAFGKEIKYAINE